MTGTTFCLILSKQKLITMDHLKNNKPFLKTEMESKTVS